MPPEIGTARRRALLERRIGELARAQGTTPARKQRSLSFAVVGATLSRAVAQGIIPFFFVKGGVAIELRLGLRARTTKDLDIEICTPPAQLLHFFDTALTVGYDDFTLQRRGDPRVLDNGAISLQVTVSYLGRSWQTVDVDIAPADESITTDAISALPLEELGFANPQALPCLNLHDQIAQKIHALTEPLPRGRENARYRDVIDVLLLFSRLPSDNITSLARACERIFAQRQVHLWPLLVYTFPQGRHEPLKQLSVETGYYTTDTQHIEKKFNLLIARLTEHLSGHPS